MKIFNNQILDCFRRVYENTQKSAPHHEDLNSDVGVFFMYKNARFPGRPVPISDPVV